MSAGRAVPGLRERIPKVAIRVWPSGNVQRPPSGTHDSASVIFCLRRPSKSRPDDRRADEAPGSAFSATPSFRRRPGRDVGPAAILRAPSLVSAFSSVELSLTGQLHFESPKTDPIRLARIHRPLERAMRRRRPRRAPDRGAPRIAPPVGCPMSGRPAITVFRRLVAHRPSNDPSTMRRLRPPLPSGPWHTRRRSKTLSPATGSPALPR